MFISGYPDLLTYKPTISLFDGDIFNFYYKPSPKNEGDGQIKLFIFFPKDIRFKKAYLVSDGRELKPLELKDSDLAKIDYYQQTGLLPQVFEIEDEETVVLTAEVSKTPIWKSKEANLGQINCMEVSSRSQQMDSLSVLISPPKIALYWRSLLDIFGYGLIGITSYCFGLVLNWHNLKNDIYGILGVISHDKSLVFSLIEDFKLSNISNALLVVLVFQFLFICLFSHSYANAYLIQNKKKYINHLKLSVYSTIGKWLEVVLLVLAIVVIAITRINGSGFVLLEIVLANGALFIGSAIRYRIGTTAPDENRFILVCPALLMIGVNVLSGASIDMLFTQQSIAVLGIVPYIFVFLIMYYKGSEKTSKIRYYVSIAVLFIVGLSSYIIKDAVLKTTMLNVFLGAVLSIYMAIFESWYIPFRQLAGRMNPKDQPYVYAVDKLLFFFPAVIILLYPFQQFGTIYLKTSMYATCLAIFIWNRIIYPSIGTELSWLKQTLISVTRALLGIGTLACLIWDKLKPSVLTSNSNELISAIVACVVPAITAIVGVFIPFFSSGNGEKTAKELMNKTAQKVNVLFERKPHERNVEYLLNFFSAQGVLVFAILIVHIVLRATEAVSLFPKMAEKINEIFMPVIVYYVIVFLVLLGLTIREVKNNGNKKDTDEVKGQGQK